MTCFDIPIVLFVFKRKDTVQQILERISQVRPKKIYVLSDEGRDAQEKELVADVRRSIETLIDWDCQIIKNYATSNRGVYENIALGAKWVFEFEKMAIFLEDDNLPEISFFTFCKELLEKYQYDSRIFWICGTNYLGKYEPEDGSSYMFTKHLLPCGWASWSDKFNLYYDYNLELVDSEQMLKRVKYEYEDKRLYYQQMINILFEKNNERKKRKYYSWDYHTAWSIRAHNVYGISPKNNQIKNIGVDSFSTHGGGSLRNIMTKRFCGMNSFPLETPLNHPKTILIDRIYEYKIGQIILLPFIGRIKNRLRPIIIDLFNLDPNKSITNKVKKYFKKNHNK